MNYQFLTLFTILLQIVFLLLNVSAEEQSIDARELTFNNGQQNNANPKQPTNLRELPLYKSTNNEQSTNLRELPEQPMNLKSGGRGYLDCRKKYLRALQTKC